MTLTEAKDQIARQKGFSDWGRFKANYSFFPERYHNEVSTLYAIEKVKEALKLAAERAALTDNGSSNYDAMSIDKQSILSLETELIENIKNEK